MGTIEARKAEIKRKLRELRRVEARLRPGCAPVFDRFFILIDSAAQDARFRVSALAAMDTQTYRDVIDAYFVQLFRIMSREAGDVSAKVYDPDDLSRMELAPFAGEEEIHRRFRELAKRHHPDVGGDTERFVEMMQAYHRLVDRT